ncbi:hypothetical protein C2G38_2083338 [Gigaspora rosea]|uniref:Uncharacterized protein n=1 Tax=Gigaspora rosea TaxID=44941 RepID=A0A397VHK4_9GLOM|nr:hypothetical protein C2G38_2083338 [Gigaspora rosea]
MNSRFAQLKNLIQPKETLIFVVGQMEIINNNLYINAKDISCINTNSATKKITECDQQMSPPTKSARSKLLSIHQSMIEPSEETPQKNIKSPILNDFTDNSHYDIYQTNPRPLKRTKNNKINEYTEDLSEKNSTDNELNIEESNNKTDSDQKHKNIELKNTNTNKKTTTRNHRKGKEKITPVVHNTRKSRKNTVNNDDE